MSRGALCRHARSCVDKQRRPTGENKYYSETGAKASVSRRREPGFISCAALSDDEQVRSFYVAPIHSTVCEVWVADVDIKGC